MSAPLPVLPPEVLGGSALCMSCGLCCTGLLHPNAHLDPDETGIAERLGLSTGADENGSLTFSLPCRHLQHDRCGVYPDRPGVCSKYYCSLLERHLHGEITLQDARAIVEATRADVARLREALELPGDPGRSFWAEVAEFTERGERELGEFEFHRTNASVLLQVFMLRNRCQQEFVPDWTLPSARAQTS